ncbi:MAG: hypothetical protein V7641_4390 [Blastocatellia bacterium]
MPGTAKRDAQDHLRILLVEDHEGWQEKLKEDIEQALNEIGQKGEIRGVSDLANARKALDEALPWHLLITDISLSGESGEDLVRRAHDKRLPCFVVSGTDMVGKADVNKMLTQYKARKFFDKPGFNRYEFTQAVKRSLQSASKSLGIPASEPKVQQRRSRGMVVEPIFQSRRVAIQKKRVFVLMPYRALWSKNIWESWIKPICAICGMEPIRADNLYGRVIMEDIWEGICSARIIIADITGRNPNVFYELGIAHTLGKEVILLTQKIEDIPFDLMGFRHIQYEDNKDGYKTLEKELRGAIDAILNQDH